jgi:hypothetical protein
MNLLLARITLIGLWLLAVMVGAMGLMRPMGEQSVTSPPRRLKPRPTMPAENIDAALGLAAARAPFRATRRLATLAYDPHQQGEFVSATVPTLPKPTLALAGIVWGHEPAAVIEGLPGLEGPRLVQRGDVVGALTIRRIEPTRVVIVGLDTMWTLTVRTPWR